MVGAIITNMNPVAVQSITIKASGADPALLDDTTGLEQLLRAIVEVAGLHPLESVMHQFSPQGASIALLLSESHVALHTWPEYAVAYITLTTCASLDKRVQQQIKTLITEQLAATNVTMEEVVL